MNSIATVFLEVLLTPHTTATAGILQLHFYSTVIAHELDFLQIHESEYLFTWFYILLYLQIAKN